MPVYEYFCEPCNGVFEHLRNIREASEPAACPECNRDAPRVMPTSFSAFTYRDGYPRRIPDKGTYWHLGKEVKKLATGGVRPNEHPEIDKPEPVRPLLKGDAAEMTEAARLEGERKQLEELDRQAKIAEYYASKTTQNIIKEAEHSDPTKV